MLTATAICRTNNDMQKIDCRLLRRSNYLGKTRIDGVCVNEDEDSERMRVKNFDTDDPRLEKSPEAVFGDTSRIRFNGSSVSRGRNEQVLNHQTVQCQYLRQTPIRLCVGLPSATLREHRQPPTMRNDTKEDYIPNRNRIAIRMFRDLQ